MPDNLYTRNGMFYARIQVAGREIRQSLRTTDRKEARARLKNFLASQSPYHGTIVRTFDQVMADWLLSAAPSLRPATLERYTWSVLKLTDHFGGMQWPSISRQSVLEYIDRRKQSGVKIPTIRRDLTPLSQAAEFAIERGWANDNPVANTGKRALRYKSPVFKRPTQSSIDAMIEAQYGPLKPLARFLLATGMRLEEAARLHRDQVDFKRGTATLPVTKNGTTRTVDLNDDAVAILKARPEHESGLFFVTRNGGAYQQASVNWNEGKERALADAAKRGVKVEPFSLHGLRHLYAIEYLERGGNIYTLQRQLGHGSLRQTEWYLQFLSPSEQEKAKSTPAQKSAHPKRFSLVKGGLDD